MSQNQRKAKQQAATLEAVVLEVVWDPASDQVRVRGPEPILNNRTLCYGIFERAKDAVGPNTDAPRPAQRRLIEIPEMVLRARGR